MLADGVGRSRVARGLSCVLPDRRRQPSSRRSSPSSKASSRSCRPTASPRSTASPPPASAVSIDFVPRSRRTIASAGMAAGLNARQAQNLECWGYPYVFEDFRLHLTLDRHGCRPSGRRSCCLFCASSSRRLKAQRSCGIDAIALLRQDDADARFRILSRATAGGAAP